MFSYFISKDEDKKEKFFSSLNGVYDILLTDIIMAYHSDPACTSIEEAAVTYPGVSAIMTYRIAHILYNLGIKTIARIMSEYSHSRTGIDIHPGAEIGESFFIDHGTGIVIGETTVVGHHVKIYQGVTLGALSIKNASEMRGVKRHPTIGNYVTIYANSSILGGMTVIGDNVTIGGNVFITKSIPSDMTVINKNPELILKKNKDSNIKI
ncbi:MAG: hypothetical protein H6687_02615 [Bacillales bacterium]|nr:hypothetical protein [Bacillales bacterium]